VTGALLLAEIFEEAGLPEGLLNVVIGPIAEIGDEFTLHPIPRLISFTGSTRVGRHIGELAINGPHLKRVALELGGNAPCVVLNDADLDQAVRSAVVGRFLRRSAGGVVSAYTGLADGTESLRTRRWRGQSRANSSLKASSLVTGKDTGNSA
jgi:delta 1-pyrroline-5-carboxylate dehydrogenase